MSASTANPTVSVVIPAYNAARWIRETLDSVLAQTFQDFEVIVVDDGSTDDTSEVVARYGDRVRYIRKENGGAAAARNAGIRAARGSYIAFLDADDLWLPEKLHSQMMLFSDRPDLAWAYSDAIVFDGKTGRDSYEVGQRSKLRTGDILRPLLLQDFICTSTVVVRRDVFDEVGYFDESPLLRGIEDWDMWLRIAGKYEVGLIDQPLVRYRLHTASTTGAMNLDYRFHSGVIVIENAVAREPGRLGDLRGKALANLHVGMGEWMMRRGDRIGARDMFAKAIRLNTYESRVIGYWMTTFLPRPLLNLLVSVRHHWLKLRGR